ncbi:hypothetical protein ACQZ4X_12015, partial [Agrobacterium vitis]
QRCYEETRICLPNGIDISILTHLRIRAKPTRPGNFQSIRRGRLSLGPRLPLNVLRVCPVKVSTGFTEKTKTDFKERCPS